eukprot:g6133.t1
MEICIIDTGTSNNASMIAALRKAHPTCVPKVTKNKIDIENATHVIVPGVATFGSAMGNLGENELIDVLKSRVENDLATMFVCVGLQILASSSEESESCKGLDVFKGCKIQKIPYSSEILVPQQGWNKIQREVGKRIQYRYLTDGHVYFSNSYALTSIPLGGWNVATTLHGIEFVSALEKGNILACQFHPELSGEVGQTILHNWMTKTSNKPIKGDSGIENNTSAALSDQSSRKFSKSSLTRRIIPCLDVKNGRVVKGVSFQGLRDAGDPVELAVEYERQGADELVMLDISATPDGRATSIQTVRDINAKTIFPLTVGGGIRDVDSAKKLLNAGADKISINTAAVRRPAFLTELSNVVGRQCTVLAIDAKRREGKDDEWEVVVKSGKERTGMDAVAWAVQGVALGAGEILLTSFDEDGQGNGFDCKLLNAVSSAVDVPVIASGGAKTAQHMKNAFESGADAVLAATIFHFGETTVGKLKLEIADSFPVRLTSNLTKNISRLEKKAQTIIPSIDLMDGNAVQLVGGDPNKLEVDGGDPMRLVNRFGIAGEVAVIDLDSAFGKGKDNVDVVQTLIKSGVQCRVGGGIRTKDKALHYLNAGATKVIIGTAASPEFCKELPRDRIMVALDARHGEVVTHGWTTKTGATVKDRLKELCPYASSFLITFVEREGRLKGCDFPAIQELVDIAKESEVQPVSLTIAGGITTKSDIARLDAMGVQAQVGMALYTKKLHLGDAIFAPMKSDRPDRLIPTVVADQSNRVLGLAYSNEASVRACIDNCAGSYWSRSRNQLWIKGLTSGDTQELIRIDMDCDRDAFRFIVKPKSRDSGFCHVPGQATCFGTQRGLAHLEASVFSRLKNAPEGSYTMRLFNDTALLENKLLEEAGELAEAVEPSHVAEEYADVLYFAMVKAVSKGVSIADLEQCLDRRALRVTRRKGDAKPGTMKKKNKDKTRKSSEKDKNNKLSGRVRSSGTLTRKSAETEIMVSVDIDGTGIAKVNTGIGFLDHMISALAKHSSMDIVLKAKGDLYVDDHHTAEDCGIMLGKAIDVALGQRKDIARWGWGLCPLDEALSRAVVDVSGRPHAHVNLNLKREMIGEISTEMLTHFIESVVTAARFTVHVTNLEGVNDHHRSESAFKALAVAFKMAFSYNRGTGILSTKDLID